MGELWSTVEGFLRANDFASGGLTVVIVGGILAYLRSIPQYIYDWFYYRLVTTVEIRDSDSSFDWFKYWLAQHNYSKKSRLIEVASYHVLVDEVTGEPVFDFGVQSDEDTCSGLWPLSYKNRVRKRWIFKFIPGDGWHWFIFRRRLLYVTKTTTESQNSKKRMESFTLAFVSRDRGLVEALMEEAKALYLGSKSDQEFITIWNTEGNGGYWDDSIKRVLRPFDSLVFETDIVKELVEDVRTFLGKRDWYYEMGIPWHRGYLISGPPGNGKTSLIWSIAGEFKRDICMLSLSTGIDEVDFISKISNMPVNSILVLEDVDCLNLQVERNVESTTNSISMSCLMNVLDGLYSHDGMLVFMTTNKLERLDPAMVRGGRADIKIEIGNASPNQAVRLFRKFFGQGFFSLESEIADIVLGREVSMATIQGAILESLANPERLPEVLLRDIEYTEKLNTAHQGQDPDAQSEVSREDLTLL